MTDIATLIERLQARKATWIEAIAVMEEAAAALQAQAQRIAELEVERDAIIERCAESVGQILPDGGLLNAVQETIRALAIS